MGTPVHQNCPFPWGIWNSHVTRCFRPMRVHNPNGTSIASVVFSQMTAACLYFTIIMVCPFPQLKFPLPMLASGSHIIRGSLGPPESGMQMATWSFQPFFAGLTSVTDWQSDRHWQTMLLGAMRRNKRNYVGYGKATKLFHVSTNNFASIK